MSSKQRDIYQAMILLHCAGFTIAKDMEHIKQDSFWSQAGKAERTLSNAVKLDEAKRTLADYQFEANKGMARLQERINKLQVK